MQNREEPSYRNLKYDWDQFKRRVELSLKMFHEIEIQLDDFFDYVPLEFDHLHVYSLKLVTIMLEAGPETITSFDLAAFPAFFIGQWLQTNESIEKSREELLEKEKSLRKKNKSLTFKHYYDFLDKATSFRTVHRLRDPIQLKALDAYIVPFETARPEWWESYNLLRHDKYSSLTKANLTNTLKAVGSLFWLAEYNSRRIGMMVDEFSSSIFVIPYKIDVASLKKL
jgi:hypothetical protein